MRNLGIATALYLNVTCFGLVFGDCIALRIAVALWSEYKHMI